MSAAALRNPRVQIAGVRSMTNLTSLTPTLTTLKNMDLQNEGRNEIIFGGFIKDS